MSAPFEVQRARENAGSATVAECAGLAKTARILRQRAGWFAGVLLVACLETAHPVYPSAEATQPLQPGATVPPVSVRAVDGSVVDLAKLTSQSGALLVFYRGGW